MAQRVTIRSGTYHDSAFLMRVARALSQVPGVEEAVVLMGTAMNLELLDGAGFTPEELAGAGPMDMVLALRGDDAAMDVAADQVDGLLAGGAPDDRERATARPPLLDALLAADARTVVTVAVPGEYAGYAAARALDRGAHVFLFSDNVPLDHELALKERATALDLLVMGPDCGTSILAGIGLGFANRVPRGPVGLVGPSGTGIQEVSSILARGGVGVSHAIGTGGRDMSAAVGGLMSERALSLLAANEQTRALVLVAKSPAPAVAERFHGLMAGLGKPVVVRYLGQPPRDSADGVTYCATLDETAERAARAVGLQLGPGAFRLVGGAAGGVGLPQARGDGAIRLVGLFSGGSLAAEARELLRRRGIASGSLEHPLTTADLAADRGHLVLDVGDDMYTRGRPHPMIDQAVRLDLLRAAGAYPGVGVLLLDVVLGDGAHADPAPEIAAAIQDVHAACDGAPPAVICSLTGSPADPQGLVRQVTVLEAAGALVLPTAAGAARAAADLLGSEGRQP